MTWSISARCPETGAFGVAVSTAVLAVGGLCPFVRAGVGAVSTQSFVNVYLGNRGLNLLAEGLPAATVRDALVASDEGRDVRQFHLVDAQGRSAAYSGKDCVGWFGHRTGDGYAVAGNMLVGEETILATERAFLESAGLPLPERLVRAMEAGQAAGGDKRGRQSAAMVVASTEDWPEVNLRIDDHAQPVAELRRLWGLYQEQVAGFIGMMPRKAVPFGSYELAGLGNLLEGTE
jgi:uncharacterized Ntn-hydrolase superfamily protein